MACFGAVLSSWVVMASGPQALSGRCFRVFLRCSKVRAGSSAACRLAWSWSGRRVMGWLSLVGFHSWCQSFMRCRMRSAIGMDR